jgi:hypothetical protein
MNDMLPRIETLMVDRHIFGIAMILTLIVCVRLAHLFIRDITHDPRSGWNQVARAFLIAGGALVAWVAVFDDWIQLFTEPYRRSRAWASERIVADPIAPELRAVTVILLAITVILAAALVARHIGGYGLQLTTLTIATMLWIPLFVIRQRLDILVHDGVSDRITVPSEFAGLSMFWLLRTILSIGVTFMSVAIIVLLVAPAVTLVLDLFKQRTPQVTTEAEGFFSALHTQADSYDDVPLRARWRPIQRPL